jgi:hypothetical protein
MADAQVPWSVGALGGAVTDPAWRAKPSWYLVATEDRMIPPPAQPAPFWDYQHKRQAIARPAVRVYVEVAVSDRLAVGIIGVAAALSVWRLDRQTELPTDGGYRAAPAR